MGAILTIDGRVGRAPEIRTTAQGLEVADFSVAVSHLKGRDKEPTTSWFRITIWGKGTESVRDWQKGDYVIVSGDFELREYTGNDGVKKTSADLTARSWTNISKLTRAGGHQGAPHGGPDGGEWTSSEGHAPAPAPARPASRPAPSAPPQRQAPSAHAPHTDDDLPF